jgi:hypothetical protein
VCLKSTRVFAALIYVVVITATVWIAHSQVQSADAPRVTPAVQTEIDKPFFSLSSNRTFGTSEKRALWLDHRGVNRLDFRVYRVNDPQRFFAQLSVSLGGFIWTTGDPHEWSDSCYFNVLNHRNEQI